MPTKPTITKLSRRLAQPLSFLQLASLVGLSKPKKANGAAPPRKDGSKLARAIKQRLQAASSKWRPSTTAARHIAVAPPLQQRGSPAAARQTCSTTTAAARGPDDELVDGAPAVLAARERERTRCEAIVTSTAGMANPVLARKLAFDTRAPLAEALALLATTPAPLDRAAISSARAARNPQIGAGGDMHRPQEKVLAAGWDRAFAWANGSAPAQLPGQAPNRRP